jgi:hypothetical protein
MKAIFLAVMLIAAAQPGSAAMPRAVVLLPQGAGVETRVDASSAWVKATGKVTLEKGAEVRTDAASKAGLFFPDGSTFLLEKNSVFGVEDTSRKKASFSLQLGRLKARVAGMFANKFSVKTPAAVCAVRGTEFDIEVGKGGKTEMSVSEGLVEVSDSKGDMAVVSSEEKILVGMNGMSRPETVSLGDERAGEAARPMAVRQETARERTRTMLEELRNRELKANEAQLGKDSMDAFGRRVRLEEYLLRPNSKEFQLLFLSKRPEQDRLDWGHLIERFNADIPDDISKVAGIIDGMYMSRTAPTNWMKYFEVYLTNTVDSIKETIDFTAPVAINFSGYGAGVRYYPGSIDYKQILSGPGVPGGERTQFQQIQDYNLTTASHFTWTQKVIDSGGNLNILEKITLDPTNAGDVAAGYTNDIIDKGGFYNGVSDPTIDPVTTVSRPSGPGMADYQVTTTYRDGSTVSSRKLLVSNEGDIIGRPGLANSDTFLAEGSFNLEMVIGSSLFQGRDIDLLFAPEILTQKKAATTTADSLVPN